MWSSTAVAATTTDAESTGVWGTYPEWFAAAGTVFTLSLAILLFFRERADRIREQAKRVYVWEDRSGDPITATVHNKSDEPIWRVTVGPLRAGQRYETQVSEPAVRDLKPGEEKVWTWSIKPGELHEVSPYPLLEFSDAADRRWHRKGSELRQG